MAKKFKFADFKVGDEVYVKMRVTDIEDWHENKEGNNHITMGTVLEDSVCTGGDIDVYDDYFDNHMFKPITKAERIALSEGQVLILSKQILVINKEIAKIRKAAK